MFCASVSVMCTSLKSFVMVDSQVVGCPTATFLLNLLLASQYDFLADVSSGSHRKTTHEIMYWSGSGRG